MLPLGLTELEPQEQAEEDDGPCARPIHRSTACSAVGVDVTASCGSVVQLEVPGELFDAFHAVVTYRLRCV